MKPRFSVVTISYNQAKYLECCLDSVISQSDVDIEYIVIDPGSTDGSREIIEQYRPLISNVMLDPDDGPADALNKGLAAASASFFCYVNSDDRLLPGALSRASDYLFKNQGVDVVYGNAFITDSLGERSRRAIPSSRMSAAGYARGNAYIIQQAAFLRTEALRAAGGFNASNRTSWDGEAFYRMAARGSRFMRVNDYLAEFRIYEDSISGSGRLQETYEADRRRLFSEHFGRDPSAIDHFINRLARIAGFVSDPQRVINRLKPLRRA